MLTPTNCKGQITSADAGVSWADFIYIRVSWIDGINNVRCQTCSAFKRNFASTGSEEVKEISVIVSKTAQQSTLEGFSINPPGVGSAFSRGDFRNPSTKIILTAEGLIWPPEVFQSSLTALTYVLKTLHLPQPHTHKQCKVTATRKST